MLKLGSLFDGSGGFPLIARTLGIEPVWAAEIEPFPIKVTRKRFPNMKHLGDVSKIKGSELEPVDILSGGSPCQSLSQAGKRDGLSKKCIVCGHLVSAVAESDICPVCGGTMAYTRSGLFMEQLRIVREMREEDERRGRTDESIRPRIMLWENVPGALSSPGGDSAGEDFRVVLEETARIKDKTAVIPRPKKGKWTTAGCIMGDGYSIAWRILDAQYWGVPQRRRRIALVADFGGGTAPEILFERKGLSGHPEESKYQREETAGHSPEGIDETGQYAVSIGGAGDRIQMNADKSVTLIGLGGGGSAKTGLYCLPVTKQIRGGMIICTPVYTSCKERHLVGVTTDKAYTLCQTDHKDPPIVYVPMNEAKTIYETSGGTFHIEAYKDTAATLLARDYKDPPIVYVPVESVEEISREEFLEVAKRTTISGKDTFPTLCSSMSSKLWLGNQEAFSGDYCIAEPILPDTVAIEGNDTRPSHKGDGYAETDKMYTLNTVERHGVAYAYIRIVPEYCVRRLTPHEEELLQGFPGNWTDGIEVVEPSEDEMNFWKEVFQTHWEITQTTKKPKTEKEIRKWLEQEPKDAELYKMWGNGIALPPFRYVMEGIVKALEG